jgi:hypothetical protein
VHQKKNQRKKQQSKNDQIGSYKEARLLKVLLFFARYLNDGLIVALKVCHTLMASLQEVWHTIEQ